MFVVRCLHCKWVEHTTGLSKDIAHLKEIKNDCSKCGKPRRFRCPKCGHIAKMTRQTQ